MDRLTYEIMHLGYAVDDEEVESFPMETFNVHIGNAINKLADYENAEEQGLLHKAEIPNGTTIYVLQTDEDDEWFIHSESYLYGVTEYFYGNFGKDFWTSKEEAEQALTEMKGGQR